MTIVAYFTKPHCGNNRFAEVVDRVDCFYWKVAGVDSWEIDSFVIDSYYFIVKLY